MCQDIYKIKHDAEAYESHAFSNGLRFIKQLNLNVNIFLSIRYTRPADETFIFISTLAKEVKSYDLFFNSSFCILFDKETFRCHQ